MIQRLPLGAGPCKWLSHELPKTMWKLFIKHQNFFKFFRMTIKNSCWSASIKEAHYLNKTFCDIDFNNFLIIFMFVYKKHKLIGFIFWTLFLDIYKSFEKYSKQNLKMAESSRSLSPNKKKVKRSKLAGVLTIKTTFKSEWKKEFPFTTSVPNDVSQ